MGRRRIIREGNYILKFKCNSNNNNNIIVATEAATNRLAPVLFISEPARRRFKLYPLRPKNILDITLTIYSLESAFVPFTTI